jgi:hypothetical protein
MGPLAHLAGSLCGVIWRPRRVPVLEATDTRLGRD